MKKLILFLFLTFLSLALEKLIADDLEQKLELPQELQVNIGNPGKCAQVNCQECCSKGHWISGLCCQCCVNCDPFSDEGAYECGDVPPM